MKKLLVCMSTISAALLISVTISCTQKDSKGSNMAIPGPAGSHAEYNPFDDYELEEYEDAFGSEFDHAFINTVEDCVSDEPPSEELLDVFEQAQVLLGPFPYDSGEVYPLADIMGRLQYIIDRIIRQDDIDFNPLSSYDGDSANYAGYAGDFYNLVDSILDQELGISDDVLELIRKALSYIDDTYDDAAVGGIMNDLIAFLEDPDGQNLGSVLDVTFEGLGKLLFAANEDMWLDGGGALRTVRGDIDTDNDTNLGLGNSARGLDAFLSGLNDISKEDAGEDISGTPSASGKEFKVVLQELISNIEDYFTEDGEKYVEGGANDYNRDTAEEYVDVELGNTLSEIMPVLNNLLMRGDRADSIIDGAAYPLELLARGLNKANFDMQSMNIDEGIYKMIQYDDRMRDRLTDPLASNLSALEKLIFVLSFANNFGYYNSLNPPAGITSYGDTGEGNHGRGHGVPTGGILTLNDCLFNITTGTATNFVDALTLRIPKLDQLTPLLDLLGLTMEEIIASFGVELNAYGLLFDDPPGDAVHRSKNPFIASDGGTYPCYISTNNKALTLMSGETVGDIGLPEIDGGGQGTAEWDSYILYSEDGFGEYRTVPWMMGWIARVTWKGEGPYYSTQDETEVSSNVYEYKSPNGEVYASVDKSSGSPATWAYGNSKYKPVWYTDYYMVELEDTSGVARYYPIDNDKYHEQNYNKEGAGCDPVDGGPGGIPGTMGYTDPDTQAGRLEVSEMIPGIDVSNADRECATHEEAIHKNFQWLLYEKKMLLVIPLKVALNIDDNYMVWGFIPISINIKGRIAAYLVIEANGLMGLLNCRQVLDDAVPGDGNSRWKLNGGYGESTMPGDYRMSIMMGGNEFFMADIVVLGLINLGGDTYNFDVLNTTLVTNVVLGNGNLVPNAFGTNIGPLKMLSFINADVIPSKDAGIDGPYWNDRNSLLPIFSVLLGELHGQASRDNNKYPFETVANGLFPLLAKPLVYYQKDAGTTPYNCWKPRLEGANEYLKAGPALSADWGTWPLTNEDWLITMEDYYQPKETNRTLISILSENEVKQCDGLIAPDPGAKVVTSAIALFRNLGDSKYDDPPVAINDDYTTWGARRKIFYGLEQIVSTIKPSKGELISRDYMGMNFPDWMFADYGVREEDILFDTIIGELLGSDASEKGIAVFPDYREPAHPDYKGYDWDNYNRLMDALSELLKDGGAYSILDELSSIIDKLLNSVNPTEADIRGLRHTLGSIFAERYFNDPVWEWRYPDDLLNILIVELPEILKKFDGKYPELLTLVDNVLKEGGLIEDIKDILSGITSDASAEELFADLYEYLDSLKDPTYSLWGNLYELIDVVLGEWQ